MRVETRISVISQFLFSNWNTMLTLSTLVINRLLYNILMLNKLFLVKFIHTMIFFFLAACLSYTFYAGITKTYDWVLLVAIGAIFTDGIAVAVNRRRCPLTSLAEKYGAVELV